MAGSGGAWLRERAHLSGSAPAVRFADGMLTWAELASQAERAADRLASLGVVRGDIVALRIAPHPRFVALFHAMQWLGAAVLPLNLRLAQPELQRLLERVRPKLLVDDSSLTACTVAVPGMAVADAFDDFAAPAARKSFAPATRVDAHATLTVIATSGTTAEPKLAMASSANHAASAAASAKRLGHTAGDVWLATLPLFHVGGIAILVRSVLDGSTVLLERGFDAGRAVAVIEGGEATMVSLVPTMLATVVGRMTAPASPRLRCVLAGGAALPPSLGRRALEARLPVSATYGMTEACSQICSSVPGSDAAASGSVGAPLEGMELRIDSPDNDGWGEIVMRGPALMRGYLCSDTTGFRALRGGWLHSGDIGRLNSDGSLTVGGRGDDMIISGGENVAPLEVERVLDSHPLVAESLVVGVADASWGQRLVALVVARDAGLASEQLVDWCRPRIAGYKIPREVRFVAALPRGVTGKVLRPQRRNADDSDALPC